LTVQGDVIDEASGMTVGVAQRDVIWLINDSKNAASVYGIDQDGRTIAELTLRSIYNRDWEAMASGVDASGDPALWIADIGDNDATYESLRVYRISEPTGPLSPSPQQAPWRRVELRYPDGPHNAEAFLVTPDGRLVVITKEAIDASVYATPTAPEFGQKVTLERVGPAPMFITDGALSPDASQIALRSYSSLYLFDAEAFLREGTDGDAGVVYPLPLQPQGETLAYTEGGDSLLIGSEGLDQPILEVTLAAAAAEGPPSEDPAASPSGEPGESGSNATAQWAIGMALIVLVSGGAALVMRRRGRTADVES
jgi:hypothetical protein